MEAHGSCTIFLNQTISLSDTGPREAHLFLPYREILGHDLKAATPSK